MSSRNTEQRKLAAEKVRSNVPQFYADPPTIECEQECTFYLIRTQDELNDVLEYSFCEDAMARSYKADKLPDWFVVMTNEGYGWIATVDKYICLTENHLAKIRETRSNLEFIYGMGSEK